MWVRFEVPQECYHIKRKEGTFVRNTQAPLQIETRLELWRTHYNVGLFYGFYLIVLNCLKLL